MVEKEKKKEKKKIQWQQYIAMLIQIIVHEAGHLVFGLISGYKFSSFRIFSFMWVKEDGKMRLKRLSIAGTGGQCLMSPPDMVDGRIPVVLYNLGGSLMNVIVSLVFFMLYFLLTEVPFVSVLLLMIAIELTKNQCIQYALDKPGVIAVLPGVANEKELKEVLSFFEASEDDKDYSVISSFTPDDSKEKCVYCKHCHPCPVGLDVALINKYYDLALLGDELAKEHYYTLAKKAGDCVACGHCDSRCPFRVKQSLRMEKIKAYFGQ